ncbi:hypothetical protein EKL30_03645 [Candidimonas sp. SYP-B2681]|uniref:hypothetical protein n=1 Tax=Candidimonas sp. SYP-B2681 TaxID=2497686 RepID=UPI000F885B61|nr:hypothetical protein [Candidimonas sp. SYP-B2681]RTZ48065.1 hypothetical protein EKL30_03645 [Candidimonas sp. SYP-B2681]
MIAKDVAYKYIKDLISQGLNDEVFPAQVATLEITSDDFKWGDGSKMSPETTIEFRGHDGVYYLVYYWEIKTVEGARTGPNINVDINRTTLGGVVQP